MVSSATKDSTCKPPLPIDPEGMSTRGPITTSTAVSSLRGSEAETIDDAYLVGDGAAMRRVRSQLQRIAPYFRVALITGESGTGKETVARALHRRSVRSSGPFTVWRAADFAEKLRAEGLDGDSLRDLRRGTLYIDGIGGIPLSLQDRLLHLLDQESARTQRTELRIVASNERDPRTLTTTGQLREELYKRIAAVEIGLAPLRRRPEDIAGVAEALMRHLPGGTTITPNAMEVLVAHPWPGNVRELRRVLQTASAVAEGRAIEPIHLTLLGPGMSEGGAPAERNLERLQDVIQRHVLEVLTRCAGNKLRASEVLGISRSTLYRMLDSSDMGGTAGFPG
jgi:DNA-binding NtrC family response regulator